MVTAVQTKRGERRIIRAPHQAVIQAAEAIIFSAGRLNPFHQEHSRKMFQSY